ncbi:UDP-4-amino-4,6-dideoxy-N-acetyl-beta-L-altrosamine transaminase [Celerinatantimonas yamalensis]|uniref:UDP-4-amino-4, 6-dideoxy-N-acetyl-beta-L-altrosamine transaminase n=1 Tax=Celerinatantimonas yamalensis TaxID=559956 RepID=A0ABW9G8M6_9GAMM
MKHAIYYGKQTITAEDISAVSDVLHSDRLTQGSAVENFEKALAQCVQAQYAVACSNGTTALHLACLGLGITAGDTVWVSAVSFVATANCARYCGADVKFIDIDPATGNIATSALANMLAQAEQQQKLPKAIIVVHLGGNSCDMRTVARLCQPHDIAIIEDSCHALGSTYQGQPIGSCQYSDCCVFSFHPVKSITTAEGGMLTCNDQQLALRIRLFASHGITKDNTQWQQKTAAPWYYEQQLLGYNYRLSDLQAALGLSQLQRLNQFIDARQQIAARYQQAFSSYLPMQTLIPNSQSAYHLALIRCPNTNVRSAIYQALAAQHIFCQFHYIPIYRQPYYQALNANNYADYPGAEEHYLHALSLPIYPTLSTADQQRIITIVCMVLDTHLQLTN